MNLNLSGLEEFNSSKPDFYETVLYLFWEKGIDYNEFKKLPIPYILTILKFHNYKLKEEEKAYKKANKRR
jgi:hypothetical protein